MKFIKKLDKEKGSVLTLAIIVLSLSSIAIMTISRQINNQIKFNQRVYTDMKYKYIAEAGIEKSVDYLINEPQEGLIAISKNKKKSMLINHNDCPKVQYIDGKPLVGDKDGPENSFYYLVLDDMLIEQVNNRYNEVLFENLKPFYTQNFSLRTYYENNILGEANLIKTGHSTSTEKLNNNIDIFIKMMNEVKNESLNSNKGTEEEIEKLINGFNEMEEYMIEIKCRLGYYVVEPEPEPEPSKDTIKVPIYTHYGVYSEGKLKFGEETKVEYNNQTIGDDKTNIIIDIVAHSADDGRLDDKKCTIESKVKFDISNLDSIKYEILSYETRYN